jgi:hypothetical protein
MKVAWRARIVRACATPVSASSPLGVERQDRYAAVIGLGYPARVQLVDCTSKSDAEQAVDDGPKS